MADHDEPIEFSDLPERTRQFLAELPPEQWKTILAAAQMYEKALTISKFLKWLIISVVAAFITSISLGESIGKFLGFVRQQ